MNFVPKPLPWYNLLNSGCGGFAILEDGEVKSMEVVIFYCKPSAIY